MTKEKKMIKTKMKRGRLLRSVLELEVCWMQAQTGEKKGRLEEL